MRNLTLLVALAAAILLITLTPDTMFILPVIGAAAVLLFTLALEFRPSEEIRPNDRPEETERHRW
jgi:multisubunit Na+/H+ antiporter MnhB subunit